jgi:hypothetical protein
MLSGLLKRVDRSASPPLPISREPIEGNALFEAMVCEFHWTALQIGAMTSCMNAALALGRAWVLRSCTNLIPVQATVVGVALRGWKDLGLSRELTSKISRVYLELADAKRLSIPLIQNAGTFGQPTIPPAKLEQMAALWRKLCEDCNEAVQELEPETRWRLSGLYTANTLMLGKFLKDVVAGGYGSVNQFGEVAMPLLPHRRRMQRYSLLQPCRIVTRGGTYVALARDISKCGLGLTSDQEFPLRDTVMIELRSGRRIKGIVVWSKGTKLGVQFENPLADNDPLLAA